MRAGASCRAGKVEVHLAGRRFRRRRAGGERLEVGDAGRGRGGARAAAGPGSAAAPATGLLLRLRLGRGGAAGRDDSGLRMMRQAEGRARKAGGGDAPCHPLTTAAASRGAPPQPAQRLRHAWASRLRRRQAAPSAPASGAVSERWRCRGLARRPARRARREPCEGTRLRVSRTMTAQKTAQHAGSRRFGEEVLKSRIRESQCSTSLPPPHRPPRQADPVKAARQRQRGHLHRGPRVNAVDFPTSSGSRSAGVRDGWRDDHRHRCSACLSPVIDRSLTRARTVWRLCQRCSVASVALRASVQLRILQPFLPPAPVSGAPVPPDRVHAAPHVQPP